MTIDASVASWENLPLLEPRRSVIDASAGTGKTYTIGLLYMRLLLEGERQRPEQILVSTFTIAAAQELRERIRKQIDSALNLPAQLSEQQAKEPINIWLRQRWDANAELEDADRRHLRVCWAAMDSAPISTLHALCAQILRDNPVLTGNGYETTEIVEDKDLLARAVNDVWREIHRDPVQSRKFQRLQFANRKALSDALGPYLKPHRSLSLPASVLGAFKGDEPTTLIALARALAEHTEQRRAVLKADGKALLADLQAAIAGYDETGIFVLDKAMEAYEVTDCVKALFNRNSIKSAPPIEMDPVHWQRLGAWALDNRIRFQRDLLARVQARMDEYRRNLGVQTFDDILQQVHAALHPAADADAALQASATQLADRLFEQWSVAIIDEFQDTDATQFGILDRIYRDARGEPRGVLLMIGDPKQAIYRFRGGDIHVFTAAVNASGGSQLTLANNFRSSAEVIAGLNTFHNLFGRGFGRVSKDIDFEFADILDPHARPLSGQAGVHLWVRRHAKDESSIASARYESAHACASHIVAQLTDPAGAIQPGDIAVLVFNGKHAAAVQRALAKRGVPSVIGGGDTVFDSDWSLEAQLLLASALAPSDMRRVRAVLISRLFRLRIPDIRNASATQQDQWTQWAGQWAESLQRGGPLALFEEFIASHHEQLRHRADFDRMHTDLRHLGELLQERLANGAAPGELIEWMNTQRRDPNEPEGRERSRRMESEGDKVRIMTVWASKGLEFPVVYLPFAWDYIISDKTKSNWFYREARTDAQGVTQYIERPICRTEEKTHYRAEVLEEQLRLLYVAMTRASKQLHVFHDWHPETKIDPKSYTPPSAMSHRLDLRADLLARDSRHEGLDIHSGLPELNLRQFSAPAPAAAAAANAATGVSASVREAIKRKPYRSIERMYSYSNLAKRHERRLSATQDGQAAADESVVADPAAELLSVAPRERTGLWSVASTAFGNALHKAMELALPVTHADPDLDELVRSAMKFSGYAVPVSRDPAFGEPQFVAATAQLIRACLDVPLLSGSELSLSKLASKHIRREMDFHMALRANTGGALERMRARAAELSASPSSQARAADWQRTVAFFEGGIRPGYMKGSMDLVFSHQGRYYVLDYKSNVLGADPAAFAPDRLDQLAMRGGHQYWLQALIYSVALHRYLGQVVAEYDPRQHLGGAVYLFMRGVGQAEAGERGGIWHEVIDVELIEAVDALL